jgi:hypothetical protein
MPPDQHERASLVPADPTPFQQDAIRPTDKSTDKPPATPSSVPYRAPTAPARTAKRCPTCGVTKPAGDFYVSRGRLSTYCKACQRVASRQSYHRRRQDPALAAQIRDRDRRRKRLERRRAATLDPDRERRNGRIRTAAVRRLIATYRAEYRALLREERARLGGGAHAA